MYTQLVDDYISNSLPMDDIYNKKLSKYHIVMRKLDRNYYRVIHYAGNGIDEQYESRIEDALRLIEVKTGLKIFNIDTGRFRPGFKWTYARYTQSNVVKYNSLSKRIYRYETI